MDILDLKQIKKLSNFYSPLKTDAQLAVEYSKISKEKIQPMKNVRKIYNFQIIKSFLNEGVVKASFVKHFSFKQSPNNTVTIFELNAGGSRADLCMVNGKSMVFEIKTQYDTFNRLDNQLLDYMKVFEYINVIVPEEKIAEVKKNLDKNIGIITYRKSRLGNLIFIKNKSPILNNSINPKDQLSQMTKKQLNSILSSSEGSKDNLISSIILTKSPNEINELFKKFVKEKYFRKWMFVFTNQNLIHPLDYQWFFKNNLPISTVYK